jgi:glycerol-3-phosphate dehydrogenase
MCAFLFVLECALNPATLSTRSAAPSATLMGHGVEPSDRVSVDVLVVGGGINGVGIARDLAGRGWKVLLCEQDDLASHTSSASTKLIHGGLRYLEYKEFGLVRKALQEREVLLRSAPHIMWPLRFVLPHDASMRPAWMIRLGLWLYDHLARREFLPGSHGVALQHSPLGVPLQPGWQQGFVYSDGWVDDARLVVLCAQDARQRGATILTRTRCEQVQAEEGGWRAQLFTRDAHTGETTRRTQVRARCVVNAAGPWAEHLLRQVMQVPAESAAANKATAGATGGTSPQGAGEAPAGGRLRLVKGSHIVVRKLFDHDHAYIFQGQDRRIIFAIPYEGDFTLVGTTDMEYRDDPAKVAIDGDEVQYLCRELGRYLAQPITPDDVVWTYSGVRPLLDDDSGNAAAVTRDYLLQARQVPAPWLTVWGGKLTTFRVLSEQAGDQVGRLLGQVRSAWTAQATLPGGDLAAWMGQPVAPAQAHAQLQQCLQQRYPWVEATVLRRWARSYGAAVQDLLADAKSQVDLGAEVAPGVFERELQYLAAQEWACTGDDVLWRRSKLGLHLSPAGRQAVEHWMRALTSTQRRASPL